MISFIANLSIWAIVSGIVIVISVIKIGWIAVLIVMFSLGVWVSLMTSDGWSRLLCVILIISVGIIYFAVDVWKAPFELDNNSLSENQTTVEIQYDILDIK